MRDRNAKVKVFTAMKMGDTLQNSCFWTPTSEEMNRELTSILLHLMRLKNDDYQIKLAVIRDFFISIIEGKLIAEVNGTTIDEESIYSVLDGLDAPEDDQETIANIMELINCYRLGPKFSCKDYDIYLDKSEKFYRVASVRAGMTISREFHKLPHDNYMGLVIIRSNEASALLLKSEDISHNSWKPDVAYSEDRK